ncbi:hypothetical protein [Chamaesiphon sp. GL140_3_metabinner_50]|nr:hypothetical protein [Chamaesiphon sp. GL140_3_metabinner_50]
MKIFPIFADRAVALDEREWGFVVNVYINSTDRDRFPPIGHNRRLGMVD